MTLTLTNREVRQLWLEATGLLSEPPEALDLIDLIKRLGFVQLDSIQNVSRAHHHVLWSRRADYREAHLDELLKARGHVFEHYTHDASILPIDMYPMWRRRIRRLQKRIDGASWHDPDEVAEWREVILARIRSEGVLSTSDFDSGNSGNKKVWSKPPHKRVLDYLWYTGVLTTSHREQFRKVYDLTERVVPEALMQTVVSDKEQIAWLCRAALERLVVGSPRDIRAFWDAADRKEVQAWIAASGEAVVPVSWETSEGEPVAGYALSDILERLERPRSMPSRMKIINPFDPVVRDRKRLQQMFGFDYKLEVFVPEAKRQWGYYVYPLLEGDRFVGRVEAKADRRNLSLNVINLWKEDGVTWGKGREQRLAAELRRFARFAGLDTVTWP